MNATEKPDESRGAGDGTDLGVCLEALVEKDRHGYIGSLIQGLIHNLNGPLQNISMLVEMFGRSHGAVDRFIREKMGGSVEQWETISAKHQKRLEQLSEQVDLLTEMLRDFMIVQEIERNQTDVDLTLFISRLMRIFKADLFFKHHVELRIDIPEGLPLARAPGSCLIPAFIYIVKNALLALRESPIKRLTIECARCGDRIRVLFRDTGIGFGGRGDEDSPFDLFFSAWPESTRQADAIEKHFGFGLFAVRKLLDPHDIRVDLAAVDGETVVTVDLPARP
jgi:signal transduction histidine kinase